MVKPIPHKSKVTGHRSLSALAKASPTEPKRLVNDVLGRVPPPILEKLVTDPSVLSTLAVDKTHHRKSPLPPNPAGATRADNLGEPIISADMEPDKLATDVRDRMEIADDTDPSRINNRSNGHKRGRAGQHIGTDDGTQAGQQLDHGYPLYIQACQ
jgi:hypothetical protein